MKKKIALLMAAAMTLSTLPMNLFAASTNSIVNNQNTVPANTLFMQSPTGAALSAGRGEIQTSGNGIGTNITGDDRSYVEYLANAAELVLEIKDPIMANQYFTLQLSNATFNFRDDQDGYRWSRSWVSVAGSGGNYGYFNGYDARALMSPAFLPSGTQYIYYTRASVTAGLPVVAFSSSNFIADSNYVLDRTNLNGAGLDLSTYATYRKFGSLTNWTPSIGGTDARGGTFTNYAIPGTAITGTASNPVNTGVISGVYTGANGNVPYVLEVSNADPTRATVRFTENFNPSAINAGSIYNNAGIGAAKLVIPIVAKTTSSSEVVVTIGSEISSTITPQSFVLGRAGGKVTSTYVDNPTTARDEFPIEKLIIKEQRVGSIGNGTVKLTLPSGYEWDIRSAQVHIEPGITAASGSWNTSGRISYERINSYGGSPIDDPSIINVSLSNLQRSTFVPGIVYITGLKVLTEDSRTIYDEDIKATISGNDTTTETFVVAYSRNWAYNFKLEAEPKTLINGRYEPYNSGIDNSLADTEHYVGANVTFQEITANTWHAERTTTFTLPEWVKIRKFRINDADNFEVNNTTSPITDENNALKKRGEPVGDAATISIPTYVIGASGSYISDPMGDDTFGTNFYPNDNRKYGHVTVNGNQVSLSNLHIQKDKRARITMRFYLSVESGYEGDITLTASGSGLREDELSPIVIAKAKNPVSVETSITDIKVGLQYQTTADVRITETGAGMMKRGKVLKLSVSDQITDDVVFTPGWKVGVESGDIKISNTRITGSGSALSNTLAASGQGTITLDIAAPSTKASTVLYSNLQVKVNRDVPQSNLDTTKDFIGYNVVAWGTAIAENYGTKGYDRVRSADMFQTPGISTPYLRVVTTATGRDTTLSNVVKVTIGDPNIVVNDRSYPVDEPAYVSTTSGSTLIPLRAVAVALGIDEETGVIWDQANKTATILNAAGGTSVQFTLGSTQMKVNGNDVPMLAPDGKPVALEVKNDRIFIPFRALGNAFGITTTWDQATMTAIYNAELDK